MNDHKTRIGFVYNALVPRATDLVASLIDSLGLADRAWTSAAESVSERERELSETSTVITAGGDGTILRTVRVTAPYDVPILSINLGKVGFMSELEVEAAEAGIARYLGGSAKAAWIDDRMMLRAKVTLASGQPGQEADALNEVALSRGQTAKLLNVEASVDGAELTTYRADGMLVSTATGSTGYAMAAGGPLINPGSSDMLLLPVAPHMCLNTGLVLPGETVVGLKVGNEADTLLSVDGDPVAHLNPGDTVTVSRSPHIASFVRLRPPGDFYATLTHRLGIVDRA
jgi:NAD+ kinase